MNRVRWMLVPVLFVAIALFNIGGCGGGGGNNGGFTPKCQMPAFTSDFGNFVYFFIDLVNAVDLGVFSDGEFLAFSLEDIPSTGAIFFVADVDGANDCTIFAITDLDLVFPASGTCERQDDGGVFVVNDLTAVGVVAPQLVGDCDEVIDIAGAARDESGFGAAFSAVKRGSVAEGNGVELGNKLRKMFDE